VFLLTLARGRPQCPKLSPTLPLNSRESVRCSGVEGIALCVLDNNFRGFENPHRCLPIATAGRTIPNRQSLYVDARVPTQIFP